MDLLLIAIARQEMQDCCCWASKDKEAQDLEEGLPKGKRLLELEREHSCSFYWEVLVAESLIHFFFVNKVLINKLRALPTQNTSKYRKRSNQISLAALWSGIPSSCTYLPLHQLFHSVFSFFRSERREGCADRNQQLAYFLMDTNPVGFLMIYIANKIRKEWYFCLLGNNVKKDCSLLFLLDFHHKSYSQQPPLHNFLEPLNHSGWKRLPRPLLQPLTHKPRP